MTDISQRVFGQNFCGHGFANFLLIHHRLFIYFFFFADGHNCSEKKLTKNDNFDVLSNQSANVSIFWGISIFFFFFWFNNSSRPKLRCFSATNQEHCFCIAYQSVVAVQCIAAESIGTPLEVKYIFILQLLRLLQKLSKLKVRPTVPQISFCS